MSKYIFLNDPGKIYLNQNLSESDYAVMQREWDRVMRDQTLRNTIANNITATTGTNGDWTITYDPRSVDHELMEKLVRNPGPNSGKYADENITLFVQELRDSADSRTVEWDEMCGEPCDDYYPITVVIDGIAHDVEIPGFVSAKNPDLGRRLIHQMEMEVFVDGDCVDWDQAIISLLP